MLEHTCSRTLLFAEKRTHSSECCEKIALTAVYFRGTSSPSADNCSCRARYKSGAIWPVRPTSLPTLQLSPFTACQGTKSCRLSADLHLLTFCAKTSPPTADSCSAAEQGTSLVRNHFTSLHQGESGERSTSLPTLQRTQHAKVTRYADSLLTFTS